MPLILTALAAAALSALLTRAMIPWLKSQGAVATENDRTMHTGAVPKGGGLPLLIAAVAVLIAFHPVANLPWPLLAGLVVTAIVSWRDDVSPLRPEERLPLHFLAAIIFIGAFPKGVLVFQGLLPLGLDRALSVLLLAGFMNFFNFMDGINGIAGSEAVAVAAGYLLVVTGWTIPFAEMEPLAASVLGATAGFLFWNLRQRALVFLGDVGSVPLGFLTGAMMIDLAARGTWVAALILPSFFLADASLTLLKRLVRGEKIWEAHKTHFYQRAAQGLKAHMPVVLRISIANALLIGAALLSVTRPWLALALAAAIVAGLLIALERAAKPL